MQRMKNIEVKDYYFYDLVIAICAADEEAMRKMNPSADFMSTAFNRAMYEWSRLVILMKYEEAMVFLDTTNLLIKSHNITCKASTLGLMGKIPEAQLEIAKLENLATTQYVAPALLAMTYMAIGDENQGYAFLEKAIKEHDQFVHFIQYNPPFYQMRNEPRYRELMDARWAN